MNWGHKITLVFVTFVSGILFLVYKASQQKQELVTTDYYEKELKYQERINAVNLTEALSSHVIASHVNGKIFIDFPKEFSNTAIETNVLLYCPFNENNDQEFNLKTLNGKLIIPVKTKQKGKYTLKINWNLGNNKYYTEQNIFIK